MDSFVSKKSLRLILVVVLSLLIAAIAARYLWFQEPPERESTAAATPELSSGTAVQLSSDEQQKIGVELVEIQRDSLNDEIFAVGRVVELTDPVGLWVLADVLDSDIARLRQGLSAVVTTDAYPEMKLGGEVIAIGPHSDPQNRTTPVRIQLKASDGRMRAGMVTQVTFRVAIGNVLTVPKSAVIDTGMEKTVYVAHESGIFERRNIHVGRAVKNRYPILDGLKPGEKVVTNGAFLIDSQTKLTGGLTGLFGGSKSFSETAPPASAGYRTTFRIDPDPPAGGKVNTVHVSVVDSSGKPVSDAQVRLSLVMPAMPSMGMPEMRSNAELKWNGNEYAGPIPVSMAGPWSVVVEARRGSQPLTVYKTNLNAR